MKKLTDWVENEAKHAYSILKKLGKRVIFESEHYETSYVEENYVLGSVRYEVNMKREKSGGKKKVSNITAYTSRTKPRKNLNIVGLG